MQSGRRHKISLWAALLPIVALLGCLVTIIAVDGPDAIAGYSPYALLGAATLAVIVAASAGTLSLRGIKLGLARSARQILPAVPMLFCIAVVATTWMVSGVVPTLICYGLAWLNPTFFLVSTCLICAVVSVLTGSSWSTIATIGVAFMGIGTVMGYNAGWIAGAIISGAYFGDKISPLSDTTVVASSACGVDLFAHMRYLMLSSVPALTVALIVFACAGLATDLSGVSEDSGELQKALDGIFNISPVTLLIPLITLLMIAFRIPTLLTLATSGLLGAIGIFVFQPQLGHNILSASLTIWGGNNVNAISGLDASVADLISTGGILGMLPTVFLVLSAMMFGAALIGTGLLAIVTDAFVRRLHRRQSIVGATVASGLMMNSTTADQYLSLIITGNMFRNLYRRYGLEPRLLSRTIEDSVSVTSVLIPWNSCGITQSTVLGVATLTYLPFCVFNWLSPCMSIILAWTGWKIRTIHRANVATA